MNPLAIKRTRSAYDAPLSIGKILEYGVARTPGQEIVYGDRVRHSYATFAERVSRLASALAALGVQPGNTVAVMDWDSHRYLECFFAVPMMGAVLHTVNFRIAAEQVLYTINHAHDDVILVNADFVPLLEIAKVNRVRIRICAEHSERPQDSVSSRPAPERGRDLMFGCNLAPLDFRHGFLQFGTLFRRRFARAFVSFGLERQEHRNCIILAFPGP